MHHKRITITGGKGVPGKPGKTGATPFFPGGKMGSCTGFSGPPVQGN
jgi:hypothetical protein